MSETNWTDILHQESDMASYEAISYEDGRSAYSRYAQAAHVMIWAKDDGTFPPNWKMKNNKKYAAILMQFRFDGMLGFAGGMLDNDQESPTDALNRELEEEINLDLARFQVKPEDHVITYVNHKSSIVLHFYALQLTLEEVHAIELATPNAKEWSVETYGTVRIPLFLFDDTAKGFATFLTNRFAGCAKIQLIHCILAFDIIPRTHLDQLMNIYVKNRPSNLVTHKA